jgi:hypothetical protein
MHINPCSQRGKGFKILVGFQGCLLFLTWLWFLWVLFDNRGKWGSTWDKHFMASHLHQFTWAAQGELHLWHWDSHQIMEPQYSCSNQHQLMRHMIIVHPLAMWHLTIHHLLDQQPMLLLGLLLVEVIPICLASKINLYLLIVYYLKWVPSASVLVFAA